MMGDHVRAEQIIRLYKLACSGVSLDEDSRALANKWRPSPEDDLDERDEFPIWSDGGRWVGPEEFASDHLSGGTPEDIVEAVRIQAIKPLGFMGFAIQQPEKAIGALRDLFHEDSEYWGYFLEAVSYLRRREKLTSELQDQVVDLLMRAPDELFARVGSAIAGFAEDLAKECGISQESRFRKIWVRAWTGVRTVERTDTPLDSALNSVAGRLAQAALERFWKYKPRGKRGLPDAVRVYFDQVVADADGWPGRTVLASRLYSLHSVDPTWTENNIISRLDTTKSNEAVALWCGYAWSPKIGPNLLAAIKSQFLTMLETYDAVHDPMKVLIGLLVMICIDVVNAVDTQRVRRAIDSLSEDALDGALQYLLMRLTGTAEERSQIWFSKLKPWLDDYWPRERGRNTAQTAATMLGLIMESGRAFPDAVSWSLEMGLIQPIHRLLPLYQLVSKDCKHVEQHPDAVLRLLAGVAGPGPISTDDKMILRPILESLKNSDPVVVEKPEFQNLQRSVAQ